MRRFCLLAILILLGTTAGRAACSGATTTWTCPAGASQSDVQTAVNSASNNATITLANGTYNWASPVGMDNAKGVTIICASVGGCNLPGGGPQFVISTLCGCVNANLYRISGFNFNTSSNQSQIIFSSGGGSLGTSYYTQVRLDHNTENSTNLTNGFFVTFGDTGSGSIFYGVVDHNTINALGSIGLYIVYGAKPAIYPASSLGTANNLFFEDNVVIDAAMTNSGGGCTDSWTGGIVFRHNVVTNCLITSHGVEHNGGPWNYEVYDNTTTQNANSMFPHGYRTMHFQGSGTLVAFGNRSHVVAPTLMNPTDGEIISVLYYRDYTGFVPDVCDGANPADGNRSPTMTYFGYPCYHQPGRDFAGNYSPMYAWDNSVDDGSGAVKTDLLVQDGGYGSPDYHTYHFQVNREWFNAIGGTQTNSTSPFNGSTGMGFGVATNRPTNCATSSETAFGAGAWGVSYFKTDVGAQGTMDSCTATNTWTTGKYVPYTYPHPLTGGAAGGNADVSPTSVAFGLVTVGTDSADYTITVTNSGSAQTTINSITLNPDPGVFTLTNSGAGSCSALSSGHLAAAASCTVKVKVHPPNPNDYTATVTVSSDAASSPTVINLSATGNASPPIVHNVRAVIG